MSNKIIIKLMYKIFTLARLCIIKMLHYMSKKKTLVVNSSIYEIDDEGYVHSHFVQNIHNGFCTTYDNQLINLYDLSANELYGIITALKNK